MYLITVECTAGTFFIGSVNKFDGKCEQCAVGRFQNLTGMTSCRKCPEDHTTAGPGAKELGDCFGL